MNGDRAFYRADEDGRILLGLIDGLGHGPGADEVARAAIAQLEAVSLVEPMLDIMVGLHQSLRGTRGAAGTVCVICGYEMQACAVGNVELRCSEAHVPLIASPGILGVRVSTFRICHAKLKPTSRLVMFSDGVSGAPALTDVRQLAPERACQAILRSHRSQHDDATVLIADVE